MPSRSRQALLQMSLVLAAVVVAVAIVAVWRWPYVHDVFLEDWKSVLLNGVVVIIFTVGVGQLYRAFGHYARQERVLARFDQERNLGRTARDILDHTAERSLLLDRYHTIKALFDRGVPIDHGTIAAIAQADESSRQSFPRFVNNVLILTGVFGTVSSLIFALIGASDVLRTAVPGEGLGVMLLGMNTALTTTATAIVCFFMFSYFFQKLGDVQTALLSRVERVVLLDVIPEFQFEPQAIDHQTKLLLDELVQLVMDMRRGVDAAQQSLGDLDRHHAREAARWDDVLTAQAGQSERLDRVAGALLAIEGRLVEGFRLTRPEDPR
ncbi:MAG: hypothetical protein R3D98_05705 [Candidatus Krumholzibacteriia bacterium]